MERMDGTMGAQENATLTRSMTELYNNHRTDPQWLDKTVAHFSHDFTLVDIPTGRTLHGGDGYRQFVLFFADGFPESRIEITNIVATQDQAVVEFTGRGINTGPLHLPTGDAPATGRKAELKFCQVSQIRDGKITSIHSYSDTLTMLQQLGLAPK